MINNKFYAWCSRWLFSTNNFLILYLIFGGVVGSGILFLNCNFSPTSTIFICLGLCPGWLYILVCRPFYNRRRLKRYLYFKRRSFTQLYTQLLVILDLFNWCGYYLLSTFLRLMSGCEVTSILFRTWGVPFLFLVVLGGGEQIAFCINLENSGTPEGPSQSSTPPSVEMARSGGPFTPADPNRVLFQESPILNSSYPILVDTINHWRLEEGQCVDLGERWFVTNTPLTTPADMDIWRDYCGGEDIRCTVSRDGEVSDNPKFFDAYFKKTYVR
jgi:hypothetical protein